MAAEPGRTRPIVRVLAWLSIALAASYFLVRGLWRGAANSIDLKYGFTSARAWLEGVDPYRQSVLVDMAKAGGTDMAGVNDMLNVYPPGTIAAFVPVAVHDWDVARLLFLVLNVALMAFICVGLVRYFRWGLTATQSLFLIAFVLALGPVHTTMSSGQSGIMAVAAIVAAMLLGRRYGGAGAGAFFGLSAVLKIQVGLPFLAYLAGRRRWVALVAAVVVAAGLQVIAIARLETAGVDWVGSWADNLAASFSPGGLNATEPTNEARVSLVNLQYPLRMLGIDEAPAALITLAFVAIAALLTLRLARDDAPEGELLSLSIVGVLTLLVAYHRFYDAVLLVLPVAWAIWAMRNGRGLLGGAVVVVTLTFLLPGQVLLYQLADAGRVPGALSRSLIWDAGLLAHHAWALLLLSIILLAAAWSEVRRRARHPLAVTPGETAGVGQASGAVVTDPKTPWSEVSSVPRRKRTIDAVE